MAQTERRAGHVASAHWLGLFPTLDAGPEMTPAEGDSSGNRDWLTGQDSNFRHQTGSFR
jgi:hypothetical protein